MPDDVEIVSRQIANPFREVGGAAVQQTGALISIEQQRAVAEVQARMMIARANPRDPIRCTDMILQDCTRPRLAETAIYQYARGGTSISGPSIRLAETIARRWGNIASGIKEISRQDGYSECVAYAWDLETGFYDERQFQVRHWRDTKQGGYRITDERDIYELIANMGQRRKRAVLLTVIPGDVVEAATAQCEETLKASADTSPEALKKMVTFFGQFGVTQAQIEIRCQCHLEAIRPAQIVQLRKIYNSLKDGMSEPDDWFTPSPEADGKPKDKLDRFEQKHGKQNSERAAVNHPETKSREAADGEQAYDRAGSSSETNARQTGSANSSALASADVNAVKPAGDTGEAGGSPAPLQEGGGIVDQQWNELQALIDRGNAAAAKGMEAFTAFWEHGLSALQRGSLGARGRGKGPHYDKWIHIADAVDKAEAATAKTLSEGTVVGYVGERGETAEAPLAEAAGDLLGHTERRVPRHLPRQPDEPAQSGDGRPPSLEIAPVSFRGEVDWKTWTVALFLLKLKQQSADELPWFLGDNETHLNAARAAGFAADIDAAIKAQYEAAE